MSKINTNMAIEINRYQTIIDLPEHETGELIAGQLYTQPRPSGRHALTASSLGADLVNSFQKGKGGPGGWWIIDEPEIHFLRDIEVAVPDIAGWRKEHMPTVPEDHRFEIVPAWICEILSPSTAKKDRTIKMPFYAQYKVSYLWLIDPIAKTLEAYALKDSQWVLIGIFKDEDNVSIAPFEAMEIALIDLWA